MGPRLRLLFLAILAGCTLLGCKGPEQIEETQPNEAKPTSSEPKGSGSVGNKAKLELNPDYKGQ